MRMANSPLIAAAERFSADMAAMERRIAGANAARDRIFEEVLARVAAGTTTAADAATLRSIRKAEKEAA